MSKSTISTFELFQMFPDAEAARVYMEGKRWPDGVRAANRSRIRQMVRDIRHYRASMESPAVLYSPLYGEWESATKALEADMWDEFWARNEV